MSSPTSVDRVFRPAARVYGHTTSRHFGDLGLGSAYELMHQASPAWPKYADYENYADEFPAAADVFGFDPADGSSGMGTELIEQYFDGTAPDFTKYGDEPPCSYRDDLSSAAVYWVSADLIMLIEDAARSLPESFIVTEDIVPRLNGIVCLERPCNWCFEEDTFDEDNIFWHREPGGLVIQTGAAERHDGLFSYARSVDPWGPLEGRQSRRLSFLAAFWLFIEQRVPATTTVRARKQLRKHDLKDADDLHFATICTLRRSEHRPTEGSADVDWTHRWVVSGHWRNQYYPSTDTHHPIWVSPHVKGPPSKPLVLKERGFQVTR